MVTGFRSTGVEGLDELLNGGIPEGGVILVAGHPGSGKSTLGAQFLYAGCLEGEAGVYASFAERKEEFYSHLDRLGISVREFEKRGLFKFLWFPLASNVALDSVLNSLLESIGELGARRLVVDSFTALLETVERDKARAFLHNLLNLGIKPARVSTILIADLPYGRKTVGYGFEEFLVDGILLLKFEEVGGLVKRTIEIRKVRWADMPRMSYEFVIREGGIELLAPREGGLRGRMPQERVPTGVEGLDQALGGGIPRGSVVLISGPSGSGKTVLAMKFAIEGANRGEKVLYVSFEEPASQLEGTARSLGLKGREGLEISVLNPSFYTPGSLYYSLKKLVEERGAERVVVDGLSALERSYGRRESIRLVERLALYCKERCSTLLFTSPADLMGGETSGAETIADVLIALWFDTRGESVERRVAVLKVRGNPHGARKMRLELSREGVWIE